MYTIDELKVRLLSELKEIADALGVKNYKKLAKQDLIYAILDQQAVTPESEMPKKVEEPTEEKEEAAKKPARKPRAKKSEKTEESSEENAKPRRKKRQNVTDAEAAAAAEAKAVFL